jgi:hypothetical protein
MNMLPIYCTDLCAIFWILASEIICIVPFSEGALQVSFDAAHWLTWRMQGLLWLASAIVGAQ